MNKKNLLARILFHRFSPLGWGLRPYGKNKLYVLAYHRIGDPGHDYPFNRTIHSATPAQFEQQLRYIKNHFNVVDFRDLQKIFEEGREITESTMVITFDDGYKDNLTVAAPMLAAHGLKAVFYTTTDNISTGNFFWFDLLHYYARSLKKGTYTIGLNRFEFIRSANDEADLQRIGQHLRTVPDAERLIIMQQLKDYSMAPDPESMRDLADILTWDDVRTLADMGFEVGSHSCSHPHLYQLDSAAQLKELIESRQLIEEKTGREVVSFSFPTGGFDASSVACVKQAGYAFAVAYNESIWSITGDRHLIPRVHVEPDISIERFKGALIFPRLFLYGIDSELRSDLSE